MVDVMGRTPKEFEEMFNAQIIEAEREVAAMNELVITLGPIRIMGFDSRREAEVEINQERVMIRVSIDDETPESDTSGLEGVIMEAYSGAGRNTSRFLREQSHHRFGGGDSAMNEPVDQVSSCLKQLGH